MKLNFSAINTNALGLRGCWTLWIHNVHTCTCTYMHTECTFVYGVHLLSCAFGIGLKNGNWKTVMVKNALGKREGNSTPVDEKR